MYHAEGELEKEFILVKTFAMYMKLELYLILSLMQKNCLQLTDGMARMSQITQVMALLLS